MSYNQHQSPEHDQANQMTKQLAGAGKEAGQQVGKVARQAGNKVAKKAGKKILKIGAKALAKAGMALGKAILATLSFLLPYILGILACAIVIMSIWWVVYEVRGSNQDYALDPKVEENETKREYKEGEGFFTQADSLSGENKAVKEFYSYYGTQRSSWQIKGNDNTKLIPSNHEDAVKDYYKKESNYSINPNFLFALDDFVFQRKMRFPEQFVEPVKYDPKTLKLQHLTDEKGSLTAESTKYVKGLKTDDKVEGVWDYGFGTVFKYKKDEIVRTVEGHYNLKDVWSEEQKKVIQVPINEPFKEVLSGYPEPIDLMTHAITFTGEYTFEYEDKKSQLPGSEGQLKQGDKSSKKNEAVNRIFIGTYDEYKDEPIMGQVPYTETETYYEWVTKTRQVPVYEWVMYPYPHQIIARYETEEYQEKVEKKRDVTKYREEQVDVKKVYVGSHDLYKYRVGAVYETVPVEKPKVDTKTEEEKKLIEEQKHRYLEDYLFYFKSYIPESVMEGFDFEERVGAIIQTNMSLGGSTQFGNGNYAGAMQHWDIIKHHSEKYGVEPEAIVAMIAQETGGKTNISDGVMQITGDGKRCSGKPSTGPEVCVYSEADRQNPDKAIAWGVAHFATKLDKYKGDYLKAIQSHNLDPQWIFKTYPEAETTLDWLNYREEMRLHYGQAEGYGLTKSASYDCIPGFDTSNVSGRTTYGDVCYLEHVLRYYNGTMLAGIDAVDKPTDAEKTTDSIVNAIKSFFGISPKNYLEDEKRFVFENRIMERETERLIKRVKTFDSKIVFSKIAEATDMAFWEKGSGTGSGNNMTKEQFLELIGDAKYAPPLDIPNPKITSQYNENRGSKTHKGIDVGIPVGTPMYAVSNGTVAVAVGNQTHSKQSWGNYVKLKLDDGNYVLYAHMNFVNVKVGDRVEMGDYVGDSGNSGDSTGPHLHFEFYYQSPEKSALKDPTWIVVQPELFE